ncbi:MAG: Glutamine--fructose-6-phosphate aminotransferase (isomerizing) [Planctomycetes bacterium ADurb.Bin126]|nr:MAG: Glutamine--fructose-6-phosphate aminotransferase (isomerizing) [Planctomycetes bacterium ADurb.Bin126]HOD83074.1 glutamine--fructose-6-phosphate transaminase (isomerizing) [Phycisphaerae bacterium]HQL72932.1 glutamine--fructose-6-phosphate transaminase (isomerizing) [Phycisphaerae bacterium]
MCGIVGYIGNKRACSVLIEGLKRLEYRGYDSAGVCVFSGEALHIRKATGRVAEVEALACADRDIQAGTCGIAHTRWATHGEPNEVNAHPHCNHDNRIAVVHNGIIENYVTLKQFLASKGCVFRSQTDTEVLSHLISEFYEDGADSLEEAVQAALREVSGTYGIAVVCSDEPDKIVVARKGSPLIVGVGSDEYIVASDAAAIIEHTANVVYLNDNEMAVITRDGMRTMTVDNVPVTKEVQQIEWSLEQIAKGGYEHFMLKEIMEQPEAVRMSLGGRLDLREMRVKLGGLEKVSRDLVRARKVILTGCGTAWHAALVGEYLFEDLARIPTEVEYASEFRYRNPIVDDGSLVIALSQSGETADTLAALREAREKGALALGIVNAVGSTIARETDAGVYLHAGPEIGVASTKAFTCQLVVETLIALMLGRRRFMSQPTMDQYMQALTRIPEQIERVLEQSGLVRQIVAEHVDRDNWLFLGRGYNYPVALEGALKLKEISYIHAEGLPAAEMKHGPIALIHEGMPVVFIAPRCSTYEKILGNIEEVRARRGRIIAVATEGDTGIARYCDHVIYVPDCPVPLQPILTVVPLQLMAYHAAVARGCNVDKPRNLAKSVTVE